MKLTKVYCTKIVKHEYTNSEVEYMKAAKAAAESAKSSATAASTSADTARNASNSASASAASASSSATNASTSEFNAATSAQQASGYAEAAQSSASSASSSAEAAQSSATDASGSASSAQSSATTAQSSATEASSSATSASTSATNASDSENKAASYKDTCLEIKDRFDDVIPTEASSSNQLADKAFVNSSIATSTAIFKGTFTSLEELKKVSADANDYAFYSHLDDQGNTLYDRYKYDGAEWIYEYSLNQSGFTAAQWAAINSGATEEKINSIPTKTAQLINDAKFVNAITYDNGAVDIAYGTTGEATATTIPTALSQLSDDETHRTVTDEEKAKWNESGTGNVADVKVNGTSVLDDDKIAQVTIPTALSSFTDDATHRLVTDSEKSTWNGKQDAISDLDTIRSGASLGATALQSVPSTYRTAAEQDAIHDSTKQDKLTAGTNINISDDNVISSEGGFDAVIGTESDIDAAIESGEISDGDVFFETDDASGYYQTVQGIIDTIYPIGSIYLSTVSANPSTYLGGTWEAYGEADTYLRLGGNGSGGSNTYSLTSANIPSHTHSIPSLSGTAASDGAHTHTVVNKAVYNNGFYGAYLTTQSSGNIGILCKSGSADVIAASAGAHTHNVTTTASTSGSYGSSSVTAVNITPKYVQTYAWKRTA